VTTLRTLRWRDYPELPQWGLRVITVSLQERGRARFDIEKRGRGNVAREAEIRVMQLQPKEC